MNELAVRSLEQFAPELRLIIEILAADHETAGSYHANGDSLEAIDWPLFLNYVHHHRIHGLLYRQLKSMDAQWLPDEVWSALRHEYVANTYRMMHMAGELERVCENLVKRSIRAIALKGPVLADMLYSDLSMRSSKDLDILVPLADLEQAESVLRELGYELYIDVPRIFRDWTWKAHHVTYMHADNGVQIELHWRLNGDLNTEPTFDELWERRQIYSDHISVLSQQDLLLYLIIHGARHGWFRLRWLVDIDRLLRSTERWEELLPYIHYYQARDLTGQALILTTTLLKTPLPTIFSHLTDSRHAMRIAGRSLEFIGEIVNYHKPPNKQIAKNFDSYKLLLKTKRGLLKYFLHRLYPNSWDSRVIKLPRALIFLYVPLRPFLWIWQRVNRYN